MACILTLQMLLHLCGMHNLQSALTLGHDTHNPQESIQISQQLSLVCSISLDALMAASSGEWIPLQGKQHCQQCFCLPSKKASALRSKNLLLRTKFFFSLDPISEAAWFTEK